jgi:hypothetical protein
MSWSLMWAAHTKILATDQETPREFASGPSLTTEEMVSRVLKAGEDWKYEAVRGGIGVDTTMDFTPAGGPMMGNRPGHLDPGVHLYLLAERG